MSRSMSVTQFVNQLDTFAFKECKDRVAQDFVHMLCCTDIDLKEQLRKAAESFKIVEDSKDSLIKILQAFIGTVCANLDLDSKVKEQLLKVADTVTKSKEEIYAIPKTCADCRLSKMTPQETVAEFVEFGWQMKPGTPEFDHEVKDTLERLANADWQAIAKKRGYINEGFACMIKNLYYSKKWDKASCLYFVHAVGARPYKDYGVRMFMGDRAFWSIGEKNNVGVLFEVDAE